MGSHIRSNSQSLDRPIVGSVIFCRGYPQASPVRQADDCLHRPFSEGSGADDNPSFVGLYCPCNNFRSTGRALIYQYHQRKHPFFTIIVGAVDVILVLPSPFCVNDCSFVEEYIRDTDRLIKESSRIIAQVEDQSVDLVLTLQFLQFSFVITGCMALEIGNSGVDKTWRIRIPP